MIAIKDMEMPICCATCHISEVDCRYKKTAFVRYSRGDFSIPSDCPLVEIITCKDCKHWDKEWTPKVPDDKEYHFCPMMDCNTAEDFYCADGERRE